MPLLVIYVTQLLTLLHRLAYCVLVFFSKSCLCKPLNVTHSEAPSFTSKLLHPLHMKFKVPLSVSAYLTKFEFSPVSGKYPHLHHPRNSTNPSAFSKRFPKNNHVNNNTNGK